MSDRDNLKVTALGITGSGKTQLLHDLFTSRAPRVLTLDNLGEAKERDPDTVEVLGWSQLMTALRQASRFPRWHIAASLEPDDLRKLFVMLAPPTGTPRERSLAYAFGGIAVECSEAYELAPNGRTPDDILAAWRRGRHYGLDLFMATQRPASVAREVTALSHLVFAFAQREDADIEYLAKNISPGAAAMVRELRRENFQCVKYDVGRGTSELLDRNRRPVRPRSVAVGQ